MSSYKSTPIEPQFRICGFYLIEKSMLQFFTNLILMKNIYTVASILETHYQTFLRIDVILRMLVVFLLWSPYVTCGCHSVFKTIHCYSGAMDTSEQIKIAAFNG